MASKTVKLCVALQTGKRKKTVAHEQATKQHHKTNRDMYDGQSKIYKKKAEEIAENAVNEAPEKPDVKKVRVIATEHIKEYAKVISDLFDSSATIDFGNCVAKADVIVNDVVLIKDAPVPFLLFLDKEIDKIRTFFEALPELDNAENWSLDVNSNIYKSDVAITTKTKKVTSFPIVVPAGTHPAQYEKVVEDFEIGHYETTKLSGALIGNVKRAILDNIEELTIAVKKARELANTTEIVEVNVASDIFKFILEPMGK